MKSSEVYLVNLMKQQNQPAFEYLYQQSSPAVHCLLVKSVRNEEIARRLVKDVFIRIQQNILLFQPGRGRLYAWVLNEARKMGLEYLKSKPLNKRFA